MMNCTIDYQELSASLANDISEAFEVLSIANGLLFLVILFVGITIGWAACNYKVRADYV